MKLNGWIRVAIVASVLYIGYSFNETMSAYSEQYATDLRIEQQCWERVSRPLWETANPSADVVARAKQDQEQCAADHNDFEKRWEDGFSIAQENAILVPMGGVFWCWLLGGIAFIVIRWVVRGFKPSHI